MESGKLRLALAASFALIFCAQTAQAADICAIDGHGEVSIGSFNTRVNVYYPAPNPLHGDTEIEAGASVLPLDPAGGRADALAPGIDLQINAGDTLLVMQMIGARISTRDNHDDDGKYPPSKHYAP